jgi:hypothetical protein
MTAARTTAAALTATLGLAAALGDLGLADDRDGRDQPMTWLRRNDEYHNQ